MRFIFTLLLLMTFSVPALAQDVLPDIPEPLQGMVDRGAQIRYLGKSHGMDGWITVFKGQEQYFYVLPDGKAFMMGLLFDKDGTPITIRQVQSLQKQGDDVLALMAEATLPKEAAEKPSVMDGAKAFEFQSTSERMFADVKNSNWIPIGSKGAPVIYSFIDPQCPHCHAFLDDLRKDYIETGKLQVRMIPVGFRDETLAQAAFLLASPDAQERFFKHLDGDKTALPAKYDINNQGIQKNLALMQAWQFDVTPLTLYQARDGEVKIIRGRAKDIAGMMTDLQ